MHQYRSYHTVKNLSITENDIFNKKVQEDFLSILSKKLNSNHSTDDLGRAFLFSVETPEVKRENNYVGTETVLFSKNFPSELLNEDGTINFNPQLISDSYRESLIDNGVELNNEHEYEHTYNGNVVNSRGFEIDAKDFKAYKAYRGDEYQLPEMHPNSIDLTPKPPTEYIERAFNKDDYKPRDASTTLGYATIQSPQFHENEIKNDKGQPDPYSYESHLAAISRLPQSVQQHSNDGAERWNSYKNKKTAPTPPLNNDKKPSFWHKIRP